MDVNRRDFLRAGVAARTLAATPRWLPALAIVVLWPSPVLAQQPRSAPPRFAPALFAPLPTEVDYARSHTTVEDCLAAVARTRAAASPEAVVEVGRRCGARFAQVDSAPAINLPLLQPLFLDAEQPGLAWEVLARRLTLLPTDSTAPRARRTLLQDAWRFAFQRGRPAHVGWAERLLQEVARLGWDWRVERLTGYAEFLDYTAHRPPYHEHAGGAYDTTAADRYAAAIIRLFDSLPTADRQIPTQLMMAGALSHQRVRAIARGEVDPLERWAVWAVRITPRILGRPADSIALAEAAVTTMAPPLTADVWFHRPDSATPRPTRGRLSLIVFVDEPGAKELRVCGLPCQLHDRFGDALTRAVEITVVTHTHGHFRNYPPPGPDEGEFWNAPPLAPAAEVALLRKHFYEHLGLPPSVALAIEVTQSTQLPALDGRRVDQPTPTSLAYRPQSWLRQDGSGEPRFGLGGVDRSHQGRGQDFVLVAPDGTIVMRSGGVQTFPLDAVLAGWLARSTSLKS